MGQYQISRPAQLPVPIPPQTVPDLRSALARIENLHKAHQQQAIQGAALQLLHHFHQSGNQNINTQNINPQNIHTQNINYRQPVKADLRHHCAPYLASPQMPAMPGVLNSWGPHKANMRTMGSVGNLMMRDKVPAISPAILNWSKNAAQSQIHNPATALPISAELFSRQVSNALGLDRGMSCPEPRSQMIKQGSHTAIPMPGDASQSLAQMPPSSSLNNPAKTVNSSYLWSSYFHKSKSLN